MYVNEEKAKNILDSVRTTYNKVAPQFVASRARDWDEFEIVLSYIRADDTILDAGCAHGRLVPMLQRHGILEQNYTGIDISEGLIDKARISFPSLRFDVGNICALPYKDNTFNVVISSAVLHHIPSQKLRIQMLRELRRVVRPGGKVMLLVWNAFGFKHLWKAIFLSYVKSILSLGKHDVGDMMLPFFGKENRRYVHAFTQRSLQKLSKKSGIENAVVQKTGKNFFILFEK